jgi:HEAT repeat protein
VVAGWCLSWLPAAFAQLSDDLLVVALRSGPADQQARSRAAQQQFMDAGTNGLAFLMSRVHLENVMVPVFTREVLNHLATNEAVSVLLDFLEDGHPRTRKLAAYWLGVFRTPEHAGRLLPLLDDDEAAGAAIRTLGKWGVREALPRIHPFLRDPKEVRRVVAANALRDLGDPAAVPFLIEALGDPVFTVRETAARALATMKAPARARQRPTPGGKM